MMKTLFNNNRPFVLIVFVKLILIGIFSSEYLTHLFIPFVSAFTAGNLDPWNYYLSNGLNTDAFPYHPLMLYILAPFVAIGNMMGTPALLVFLIKLPLLAADIAIYFVLVHFLPTKANKVNLIYFLNPIVFYSIYIHSQLDIIPTALLILAIYFLSKRKLLHTAVFIGLALATKTHILIAIPLILIFILKVYSFKAALRFVLITVAVFLVFEAPFLSSAGFREMVLLNAKQSLLFDSFYSIGTPRILFPILSLVVIYFHFFNQRKVNFDLLFFYFGILFTSTIFFVYPSPAWYVWIVPFISHYFVQNYSDAKYLLLHFALSLVYLVFFVCCYHADYREIFLFGNNLEFKIGNENISNVIFTLMEGLLIIVMYGFYKYGIKSNSVYSKQLNLAIGIGGDSGSGKSLLMHNISELLKEKLLKIEGDGEHKWERGDKNWETYTHLDPKANNIHQQATYISDLKENRSVYRSEYDHHTGKFTSQMVVKPKEFIVISGLHPFYLPKMRKNIDLKIYVDTEEKLRRHWKIIRDVSKRGYTPEKILEQIESRQSDAEKFIYPQKAFADMVIQYFSLTDFVAGNPSADINLGLRIILDANIPIEHLLSNLNGISAWDYHQDLTTQYIELNTLPDVDFKKLAAEQVYNVDEIISPDAQWLSGYEGLVQFIILLMISDKLKKQS